MKLRIIKPIGRLQPGDIYETTIVDSVILRAFGIAEIYGEHEQPFVCPEEGDVKKPEEQPLKKKKKKKKMRDDSPLSAKRNTYGRRDMRAEE